MKTIRFLSILVLAGWLTNSIAHGQQPAPEPVYAPPSPFAQVPADGSMTVPARSGLSDWILNHRECCEGPLGKLFPLYTELYFGGGTSSPIAPSTSAFARELQTGWALMGGARALFFNEPMTKAWVFDAHILNIHQFAGAHNTAFPFTLTNPQTGAVVTSGVNNEPNFRLQDVNRTLVGIGLGREWYLWKPATDDGCMWRVGVDVGGRYGSERLNIVNGARSAHTTDVITSSYLAVHTDIEMQCRYVLFHAGLRLEWAYTFGDILQMNSDEQDINFLLTAGIRF